METRKQKIKMVPPDGGWGWLIVIGSSLINFSTRAIEPSFGLLFGDLLKELGVETTGASLVMSTLSGTVHFTGLFVGPLIKRYTYRKVAIIGGMLSSTALLLTAPAKSMFHLLTTFGFIGGIGFGLATACTLVGINDYFSKKKGQAVGLAMAGTAIGFMTMPQIVRLLLDAYDFRSALFLLGALSLHAVVGACLFQPASWHRKAIIIEEEKEEEQTLLVPENIVKKHSIGSIATSTNGLRPNLSSTNLNKKNHQCSVQSQEFPRKGSLISNVSLLSETGIMPHIHGGSKTDLENVKVDAEIKGEVPKKQSRWSRFAKFMDFDLLTDGVYLNILYGLSICIVAELNFKLIVPFFLMDLGFTKSEIAYALSIMAVADMSARVIVPPILDRVTLSRRFSFMFGSFCVGICRSCLALQTKIVPIITVFFITGFFRGITLTSSQLVLTEYASGNNFPSVLGLCMVSKGIFIAVLGPLSGYVRDLTQSYSLFIHFQTILIVSVMIFWSVELFIIHPKSKKKEEDTDS